MVTDIIGKICPILEDGTVRLSWNIGTQLPNSKLGHHQGVHIFLKGN
jgi:hypothetical protein